MASWLRYASGMNEYSSQDAERFYAVLMDEFGTEEPEEEEPEPEMETEFSVSVQEDGENVKVEESRRKQNDSSYTLVSNTRTYTQDELWELFIELENYFLSAKPEGFKRIET